MPPRTSNPTSIPLSPLPASSPLPHVPEPISEEAICEEAICEEAICEEAICEEAICEEALVRKLDRNIIPMVMALYLFSFLDRVNIGNARLYGLEEDLGLVGVQFQVAVSILFVTYIIFEIPSNLVLKKFHPRRHIAGIAIGWGVVATLMGVVRNYEELLGVRLLLGVLEAGLFPGLTVYLTFFYTKREFALRIGYLFVSAALAGACGGLLAYCIGFMDGVAGMRGWRWIFILEGFPTVLVGVLSYFVLADDPDNAGYLTPAEKGLMKERMLQEMGRTDKAMEFHWKDVRKCFLDWHCWAFAIAQFGVDTMLYGFSTFLPTIIKSIFRGTTWTTPQIQALTIPCYVLGAVIYLLTARLSDTSQSRALPTLLGCGVSISGYTILLIPSAPAGVHYLGTFLIAAGLYVAVGLPLSWLPSNSPRYGKRTAGSGLQLSIGNVAGVMTPFIYPSKDGPRYTLGHAVTLGMVAFGGTVYAVLWWSYARTNKGRRAGSEEDSVNELGDDASTFKYTT